MRPAPGERAAVGLSPQEVLSRQLLSSVALSMGPGGCSLAGLSSDPLLKLFLGGAFRRGPSLAFTHLSASSSVRERGEVPDRTLARSCPVTLPALPATVSWALLGTRLTSPNVSKEAFSSPGRPTWEGRCSAHRHGSEFTCPSLGAGALGVGRSAAVLGGLCVATGAACSAGRTPLAVSLRMNCWGVGVQLKCWCLMGWSTDPTEPPDRVYMALGARILSELVLCSLERAGSTLC